MDMYNPAEGNSKAHWIQKFLQKEQYVHKQIVRMPLYQPQPQRKMDWLWRELNLQECDSLTIEDFSAID